MACVGDKIYVQDKKDLKFYKCLVMASEGGRIKINFIGWKEKYDEWLEESSPRIMLEDDGECQMSNSQSSVETFVASLEAFGDRGASAGDVLDVIQRRNNLKSFDVMGSGDATRTVGAHRRVSSSHAVDDTPQPGKLTSGVRCCSSPVDEPLQPTCLGSSAVENIGLIADDGGSAACRSVTGESLGTLRSTEVDVHFVRRLLLVIWSVALDVGDGFMLMWLVLE